MYKGDVYFDGNGNHIRRPYYWLKKDLSTKPNFIFKDTLVLKNIVGNEVQWLSVNTGRQYISFVSDMMKFAKLFDNTGDVKMLVSGYFTFRKNGQSTGLIPTVFNFEDHTVEVARTQSNTMTIRGGTIKSSDFLVK